MNRATVRLTMKIDASVRSAAGTAMSVLILLVCVFMSGCRETPTTTWSSQVQSPDGIWLATARSEQGGSFGGSYNVTTVSLKRSKGSEPPTQVLLFSHEYATMNLKMEWLGPTHLNVTYGPSTRPGDHADVNFQAVKCAGIDISIRDFSTSTTNPSPQAKDH